MKQENHDYLYKKYPKIFVNHRWGIACGDGWLNLIDDLCGKIQARVDELGLEQVVAMQVKEKFGGLRFYVWGADETIHKLIEQAEQLSEKTCETCGEPGTQRTGGWVRTLCDKHAEGRKAFDNNKEV